LYAKAIREHLTNPQTDLDDCLEAVCAVMRKCEQMRQETKATPGGIGHFIADEFERVMAEALGIETEGI
jgi:hypothetical protein